MIPTNVFMFGQYFDFMCINVFVFIVVQIISCL